MTDANIISDDSSNLLRRVSVNLHRVPWLDGLQSILNSRNYRLEERGSIYFVKEDKVSEPILTKTFPLNHASAKELADLFNKNYGKKDVKGAVTHPIATSFDGANVVVVTSTEKTIADCESIIKSVDKAVAQIYIEARFLELSSEAMHKLGIQWNQLESWGGSVQDLKGGFEYNNGRVGTYGRSTGTRSFTADSSLSKSTTLATGTTTHESSARNSISAGFNRSRDTLAPSTLQDALVGGVDMAWRNARGFSGQFSAEDFRLALSAFESVGEGRIFSNPKVIVSNGKAANVDMTIKFPNVKLTSQRNNSDYGSYLDMSAQLEQIPGDKDKDDPEKGGLFAGSCFFEWGIKLSVVPRISPDGLISVKITPMISQLDYDVLGLSSDEEHPGFYSVKSDVSVGLFPIINMKRIETDFTMKDGSTAVIGGLSRTTEEDVDSGIPYLRKLPWIGQTLFGWKSRQKVQKEIIVCVTLGLANPAELPKDIGLPKNAILGREYVSGVKLEPGDRPGSALEALKLDLSALDDKKRKQEAESEAEEEGEEDAGTVTITPVK